MIIGIVQIGDFTVNAAYEHHMQCQLSQYTISANLTEMNGLLRGLSGYKNNVNQTLYLNMAAGSAVYLKRIVLTVDGRSEYDHTYKNYGRWVTYPFSSKKYGVGTHTAKWTLYDVNGSVYNISNTWKVVEKTYTISFHANGGSNAPASQTKYYGKTLVLSNSIPSRSGYTFLGWSENSTMQVVQRILQVDILQQMPMQHYMQYGRKIHIIIQFVLMQMVERGHQG